MYLVQSMVGVAHKVICAAQRQQNSTVCLCHTALCLQSLSILPLIHLLSSRCLSPRHPSIHLPSLNDCLCPLPPRTLLTVPLSDVTNSYMRFSDRTQPWTLRPCFGRGGSDQRMRRWREGEQVDGMGIFRNSGRMLRCRNKGGHLG